MPLLSVPVHNITTAETVARIGAFITEGGPHQLCTVNPEFVMAARRDAEFMAVLRAADLCLPDGAGLLWASRVLGQQLRERVAGSDLVPLVAAEASRQGWALFLLGAAEGVAGKAAATLQTANPGLRVTGVWAGSPLPAEEESIVARIRAAHPHILFVAYGAPAQDKWIARNRARLGVPVMMGVGGALDFVAGAAVRAPRWMQRAGLEWLHRLAREPWRWRRMLALPQFAVAVLRERLER
ncbi:MAG: WecB/TagA/CpsF family glycosyltransferase [Chloroflexi bacterium]|nr:WecB/TagA/CpsF family glycosyltransferase [Chloroflexota bacterium]